MSLRLLASSSVLALSLSLVACPQHHDDAVTPIESGQPGSSCDVSKDCGCWRCVCKNGKIAIGRRCENSKCAAAESVCDEACQFQQGVGFDAAGPTTCTDLDVDAGQ
jgi:hypothetical protein